jgi:hypothetical protein
MYNTSCVVQTGGFGGNFTNVNTGTSNIQSVYLSLNGNVIGLPFSGGNIVSVDPNLFTYSNIRTGGASFASGAVLPSGNIICAPYNTSNVGMFDTVALTYSNLSGATTGKVAGATLLPDGRVVFSPDPTGNIGVVSTMVPVDSSFCLSPFFNKL